MNLPRLFKLPEYRKFTYHPLYYDHAKEEREARLGKLDTQATSMKEEQYTRNIRRRSMKSTFKRREQGRKESNIRLIIIIAFLIFISYILLFR